MVHEIQGLVMQRFFTQFLTKWEKQILARDVGIPKEIGGYHAIIIVKDNIKLQIGKDTLLCI